MDLLILGASTRAAAFSARRIGLRPTCIDLFADADLAAVAEVRRVDPDLYPDAMASVAADLPPLPWIYTGAVENRPDLVDQVSTRHRLLGNDGPTLRAVRDPAALAEAARAAGLAAPEVRIDPTGLPVDGSWLRKPLASAGGRGISPWLGQDSNRRPAYYQRRIVGLPASAVYVGAGGTARCVGVTRQFVGRGSNRFVYRGSLAPWPVSGDLQERVDRLGHAIASWFGLAGLFGVDLVLRDDQPWPIEVNPRYSASVEALEWALGRSLLAEHLRATGFEPGPGTWPARPLGFAAKLILFAARPFRWPETWSIGPVNPAEFPEVADIPHPGTEFQPGEPVMTVFARGDSPEQCRKALAGRSRAWRRRIRCVAADLRPDRSIRGDL